jgi:hypothetical protein
MTAPLDGPGVPPPAWPPRADAAAAPAPSVPQAAPALEAGRLRGAGFYEAMGRPDLASSYRHRRAAKIAVVSAGGGVAVAGIALLLGEIVFTGVDSALRCWTLGSALDPSSAPPCPREEISPWPVALVGVGAAVALVGAIIPIDPLTPTERHALQLGVAPAALGDGGSVLLRGRF